MTNKIIHYEINGEIGDVKKRIAMFLDNLLTDKPAQAGWLNRRGPVRGGGWINGRGGGGSCVASE